MLIRMTTNITGFRNGEQWPPIGDTIDLPAGEAEVMIANKYAEATDGTTTPPTNPAPANNPDSAEAAEPDATDANKPDIANLKGPALDDLIDDRGLTISKSLKVADKREAIRRALAESR